MQTNIDKTQTNNQNWKSLVFILRKISESKGISQKEIANRTGMLRNNINRIFRLKHCPNLDTFLFIAEAIGVNFSFDDKESTIDLNKLDKDIDNLLKSETKESLLSFLDKKRHNEL